MRTKSNISIMMVIIMKLSPLMLSTPFGPGTLYRYFILCTYWFARMLRS